MKVLVTSTPGLGHVLPMIPVAGELRARGHEVRWLGGQVAAGDIEARGIPVQPAGMSEAERQAELARRYPGPPPGPKADWQVWAFPKVFAEIAAPAMLEPVRSAVDAWAPDVVLHDAAELAAPLAAATAGVPSACHGFGQLVPEVAVRAAADVLAPTWRGAGLSPDRYAGSYRGLYVDIYPPSLATTRSTHVPRVQRSRPAEGSAASGTTAYVTFGTLFNHDVDLLRATVLAAASVAEHVVVTIGRDRDPSSIGPTPDNVRVEPFVVQADLLPHCATVICHGGSGTVLAALAHAVPVVCIPQGADQFANAANVSRLGAGVALDAADADRSVLAGAIEHSLQAPGPREAAAALAREIQAMPGVAAVASTIEELVAGQPASSR